MKSEEQEFIEIEVKEFRALMAEISHLRATIKKMAEALDLLREAK